MTINSVDMTKALNNEAYAAQVIRSGKCSASERGQLAAHWGCDKITKWESIDATKYEIELSDSQKVDAKNIGTKRAEESAKTDKEGNVNNKNFDGKADNGKSKATAVVAASAVVGAATALIAFGPKAVWGAMTNGWVALGMAAALLAMALVLKAMNPNAEQAQACDNLKSEFDSAEEELGKIQDEVAKKTDEITDKTDALMDKTEDKMNAEKEYTAKKDEIEGKGEPLTKEQEAGLQSSYANLKTISDEDAKINDDLTSTIEKSEDLFDSQGEKIEEVNGLTEYQAEFDDETVENANLVKMAGFVGIGASTGVAAGAAIHSWKVLTGEAAAAIGAIVTSGIAGVQFGKIVGEQNDYKNRAEAGVDNRHHLEDVNLEKTEQYEESLDALAVDMEFKDETKPNIALTAQKPVTNTNTEQTGDGSEQAGAAADEQPEVNPFAPPSNKAEDKSGGVGDDDSNPFGGKVDKDKEL